MSLKVCTLAVDEEAELGTIGINTSHASHKPHILVNRGPKHKTVFSPAFIDEAVITIRGKLTVSF